MKQALVCLCIICCFVAGCASQTSTSTSTTTSPKAPSESYVAETATKQSSQEETDQTVRKIEEFFGVHSPEFIQETAPPTEVKAFQTVEAPPVTTPSAASFQAQITPVESPQPKPSPDLMESRGVGLNFDNADIYDVVKVVSEITGKSFILDKDVSGTVTIFSETSMTPDQVFELFKSVLELNGLAITQVGEFYKIVRSEEAQKRRYLEVDSGTELTEDDRLITQIVKLKYVRAEDVKKSLQSLVPPEREIIVYPDSEDGDTLIVTDIASNVRKILSIIKEIDVSKYANRYFEIFPIKHANLSDLVNDLGQILSLQQLTTVSESTEQQPETPEPPETEPEAEEPITPVVSPGTRTKLYPILRLNALVVSTNNAEVITLVRKWLDILDQPSVEKIEEERIDSEPMTHVYHVQYAKAEDLAQTLAKLYENQQPAQDPDAPQSVDADAPVFIADPSTNFLVIKSTLFQYAQIQDLLKEIDRRPLQVLIDVMIAEVSLLDTDIFGVQGMLLGQDQVTVGGETNSVNSTMETLFTNVFPDDGQGFRFALAAAGRFEAQLRALATEDRVRVLSAPHVIVKNNEEASVNIGSRIPVKEVTGSGEDTKESYSYENTGVILKVTPQINTDGDVVMIIEQEVSAVGQESFGDTGAASFTTRKSTTTLVTKDGYPLLIGGLISNRVSDNRQGVPILKDLPLLGKLFRYSEQKNDRTELIILVTPRVVRTPEQGWELTDDAVGEQIRRLEQFFNKREDSDPDKLKQYLRKPLNMWKKE